MYSTKPHNKTYDLINSFLEQASWFEVFVHEPVRTSEEASKLRTGYTIENGAKALILKTPSGNLMLVVPGDKRFDNSKLKTYLGVKTVSFATEEQVAEITNGVRLGGVPPFGSVFGLKTYVDKAVLSNEKIIFNCADKTVSVGLYLQDYLKIEKPTVVDVL